MPRSFPLSWYAIKYFVSAINQTTLDGEVYFYRGSWSQWSNYQILTPLHDGNDFTADPNQFGAQMDADPVHGRLWLWHVKLA